MIPSGLIHISSKMVVHLYIYLGKICLIYRVGRLKDFFIFPHFVNQFSPMYFLPNKSNPLAFKGLIQHTFTHLVNSGFSFLARFPVARLV